MKTIRTHINFYDLEFHKRREIAFTLGLIKPTDAIQSEFALSRLWVIRAQEHGKYADLINAIEGTS